MDSKVKKWEILKGNHKCPWIKRWSSSTGVWKRTQPDTAIWNAGEKRKFQRSKSSIDVPLCWTFTCFLIVLKHPIVWIMILSFAFVLVSSAFVATASASLDYVSYSPYSALSSHALYKRQTVTCDNQGIYAAGSSNDFASAPSLDQQDDAYLQAFVSPKAGFLCTLSISVKSPSTEAKATLRLFDDTTAQIAIVNGTASSIASSSGS